MPKPQATQEIAKKFEDWLVAPAEISIMNESFYTTRQTRST
ncbi:hypothetical protein VCHA41O245_60071 [Vibrio chagasii]|nr:hypothetical protein VCHA41O245_60071 [Vibrio chagasii]